jgi:glucose-6-phosphate 1-dehydrogenase
MSTPPHGEWHSIRSLILMVFVAIASPATLFIHSDKVEQCWRVVNPIGYSEDDPARLRSHLVGSGGNKQQMLARDGRV